MWVYVYATTGLFFNKNGLGASIDAVFDGSTDISELFDGAVGYFLPPPPEAVEPARVRLRDYKRLSFSTKLTVVRG